MKWYGMFGEGHSWAELTQGVQERRGWKQLVGSRSLASLYVVLTNGFAAVEGFKQGVCFPERFHGHYVEKNKEERIGDGGATVQEAVAGNRKR